MSVSKPPRSLTDTLGLVLAFGILAVGVAAPLPFVTDSETQLVFAVFFSTIVLWVAKPVPYAISSILCVILLYFLGLTESFGDAVSGFSSNLVFFLILLFLIGKSVDKVDLDVWLAARLVSSASTPKKSVRKLSLAILSLAFLMPSGVARTVTMMPVIDNINEMYAIGEESRFRHMSYFAIGHVNPIMSLALMTGGGVSVISAELINASVRPITWVEWAVYMVPPVVSLFLLSIFAATLIYDIDDEASITDRVPGTDRAPDSTDGSIESLTREQRIVVGTLLTAVAFWIAGSFLGIPTVVPAMFVVLVFSLPGVRIITAREVQSLSWGIIFLAGAMLSLLAVMEEVNAFDPMIAAIASALPSHASVPVLLSLLFGSAVVIRGFFSSVSTAYIILFPVLMEFAALFDVDSLYVALSLSMLLISATFLPFNSPPVLIAYERGPLSTSDVFSLGLVTLAAGGLIVVLSWAVYWPLVDVTIETIVR